MLEVIESYAHVGHALVTDEILRAWATFDSSDYIDRVVRRMPMVVGMDIEALPNNAEVLRCMRFMTIRGQYAGKLDELAKAVKDFSENCSLRVGGYFEDPQEVMDTASLESEMRSETSSGRFKRTRGVVSLADAERLTVLPSIKRLSLGLSDRGVLGHLSRLNSLCSLEICVTDSQEMEAISEMKALTSLRIHGLGQRDVSPEFPLDLRVLDRCPHIHNLELRHLGENNDPAAMVLPLRHLRVLEISYAPMEFLSRIGYDGQALRELRIQCGSIPTSALKLGALSDLSRLSIYTSQVDELLLDLPGSLTELRLAKCKKFRIRNIHILKSLQTLTLSETVSEQIEELLKLPSLQTVIASGESDASLRAAVKAAARPDLQIY